MILSERIKKVVDYSGLTIPKFANLVGFKTPQTVRELINGRTKTLSFEVSKRILSTYPEINKDWLTDGEGEMLKTQQSRSIRDINGNGNFVQNDHSINIDELKVKIENELASDIDVPSDVKDLQNEVIKLRRLLAKAEKEIARLEGKVEQQNETIKILIGK